MKTPKRLFVATALVASLMGGKATAQEAASYVPAEENLKARQEFADSKLGIFIHWGIYSMFAQGEWYMTNANIDNKEYAKAASAFYPIRFDAKEWVSAIKAASTSASPRAITTVFPCGTPSSRPTIS